MKKFCKKCGKKESSNNSLKSVDNNKEFPKFERWFECWEYLQTINNKKYWVYCNGERKEW